MVVLAYLTRLFDLYPNVIFYFASLRFICYICASIVAAANPNPKSNPNPNPSFDTYYIAHPVLHIEGVCEREIDWGREREREWNSIDNPCPCACRDVHLGVLPVLWGSRSGPMGIPQAASGFNPQFFPFFFYFPSLFPLLFLLSLMRYLQFSCLESRVCI